MTDEAKKIVDALNNCSICDSDCIIDAVNLIGHLSAENEVLRNNLTQRKDCKNCAHSGCGKYRCKLDKTIYGTDYVCRMFVRGDAADLIERLSAELEKMKLERDAAVNELADLEKLISPSAEMCSICKYAHCEAKVEPCASCEPSHERSKWEWRGVVKENSGGTDDSTAHD